MSKPIPSTGKTAKEYFRDYPLIGHAADMPKSTRMTQSGLCLCLPRIARQVSLEHLQHIIPDWVARSAGPSSR